MQCQYFNHCPRILDHPRATPEDGRIVAEISLYRLTLKLQNSPQRLRLGEVEYEEIERWKMEWAHLLCELTYANLPYAHKNPTNNC